MFGYHVESGGTLQGSMLLSDRTWEAGHNPARTPVNYVDGKKLLHGYEETIMNRFAPPSQE